MISNLLLVLRFRVNDDFGDEGEEDVFEELGGHDVARPIVSVLHYVEHVSYAANTIVRNKVSEQKRTTDP